MSISIMVYSIIFTVVDKSGFSGSQNRLYGSLLAIASAIGFGLNIVLTERFCVDVNMLSYLAYQSITGLAGSLIFTLAIEI